MLQLSDVDKILSLHSCGWGSKRIANELGISRRIVKKYIRLGRWEPPATRISRKLIGLDDWLRACYEKYKGNADVVRQELIVEQDIHVSLRTVERAVQKWKQGEECVILPSITDPEDLKRLFPKGYRTLKPYLRMTPQPDK